MEWDEDIFIYNLIIKFFWEKEIVDIIYSFYILEYFDKE